jgi:ABC-type phosphate transport system auxiliary subunit
MTFPTAVRLQPEVGVPGDRASMNPIAVISRIAQTAVTVARFVWPGTDTDNQVQNTGSGLPLGFAIRNQSGIVPNYLQEASMQVPAGFPVEVAERGEFFATSANVATQGQKVFATLADGTLQFGAKGATISGAIETPFAVERGGAANSVIKISTWSNFA